MRSLDKSACLVTMNRLLDILISSTDKDSLNEQSAADTSMKQEMSIAWLSERSSCETIREARTAFEHQTSDIFHGMKADGCTHTNYGYQSTSSTTEIQRYFTFIAYAP